MIGNKMQALKLITETVNDCDYLIEKNEDGEKTFKIKGIFMQADMKNRNGRVYPMEILQNEVNKYNKTFVEKKRAFGELGHPDGPTVNLERVSHMITALYADGKNFIGEAKIMSTPMGEIVKSLMKEGATLGVSSRGMGSLEQKNGANVVRKDFQLATAADIVADPSAPSAFVEGIMEGKEWVWSNGAYLEAELVQLKKNIDESYGRKDNSQDATAALEFAKFLKML